MTGRYRSARRRGCSGGLRRSELAVLANVGHRPAEERPEAVAGRIEAWCAQLPALERRLPVSAAD